MAKPEKKKKKRGLFHIHEFAVQTVVKSFADLPPVKRITFYLIHVSPHLVLESNADRPRLF